jgi:enoyl-[acyl-carrier-protein] reductase (NADH)
MKRKNSRALLLDYLASVVTGTELFVDGGFAQVWQA